MKNYTRSTVFTICIDDFRIKANIFHDEMLPPQTAQRSHA